MGLRCDWRKKCQKLTVVLSTECLCTIHIDISSPDLTGRRAAACVFSRNCTRFRVVRTVTLTGM